MPSFLLEGSDHKKPQASQNLHPRVVTSGLSDSGSELLRCVGLKAHRESGFF